MFVYNNTFAKLSLGVTGSHGNGGTFSGGVAKNNLLWQAGADWASWGIADSGNLTASADPFASSAASDFHMRSGAAAINAGQAIAPVAGQSFAVDMDGALRGADGQWDMEAYEYR
jgi:hypothetical protein